MTHFFDRRDRWGNSPAIGIVALMAFLVPFGWWSLKQFRLENDVEHWLPASNPEVRALAESRQLFPSAERIFVSWDGSSLGDPRVRELARRMEGVTDIYGVRRNGLKEIATVTEPNDVLLAMQRGGVEPDEAARRLRGVLLGAGPLKVRLTEAGRERLRKSKADLTKAVQTQFPLSSLAVLDPDNDVVLNAAIPRPAEDDEETPESASPALLSPAGQLLAGESADHDLQLAWDGLAPGAELTQDVAEFLRDFRGRESNSEALVADCFFVVGSPVALAVELSDAGLADKPRALQLIREQAAAVGIPRSDLRMAGSVVAGQALQQSTLDAAWNPAAPLASLPQRSVILLSVIVSAVLSFLLVRSLRLTILILAVSVYATCLSLAIVPVTGGSLNMVLAVLPTLLFVITLSGAIHVVNYWKHAAQERPATAISETFRTALFPCALAGLTTAIGLLSLCTSSLTPVREFGFYAAIGTLIALGAILFGLTSLLQLWPSAPPKREDIDRRIWRGLGSLLVRRPLLQAAVLLALCALGAAGLRNFRTETKVIRYFPNSSGLVQDYRFLEDRLAGSVPVEVLVRFDPSAQEQVNFVQRMEVVRSVTERLRGHAEVTGCLSLADFQPVLEVPEEDAGMMARSRFHKQAGQLQEQILAGENAGTAAFYRQVPEDTLQTQDRQRLSQPGEELWRITAQARMLSDTDYGAMLKDIDFLTRDVLKFQPGTHHAVTGGLPLSASTQQAVIQTLLRSFGLTFALVLGVFVVSLRNLWAGLVAMIPNVLPIAVVFGLLGWCGQRVDLDGMIAASIALGLAADGTLHFLTSFRQRMRNGLDRRAAILEALEHCGPAISQTSAVVAVGLLMLLPADLVPISRFGGLMAAMIGLALVGDIVLLPQLLASPLGNLFVPPPPGKRTLGTIHPEIVEPRPPHVPASELAPNLRIQP
jgi:predicted RND superfamily exporter protein